MIRFLIRTLGLLFLAAAFVFLVYDGTQSISASQLVYTKVSDVWPLVHAASYQQLQPWIESHARWILDAPAAVVLAIVGVLLIPLGRRGRPQIGYAR